MTYSGAGRRSLSIDSASIAHSMPLPGPSRPHVNTRAGPPLGVISARRFGTGSGGAVRNQQHLRGIDVEAREQSSASRFGHHDDRISGRAHPLEYDPLVRRGFAQHGVGHHHDRHVEAGHQLDDRLTVGPVVQAVLVLDDDHVVAVQRRDRGRTIRRRDRHRGRRSPTRPRPPATVHTAPRRPTRRRRSGPRPGPQRTWRSRRTSAETSTGCRSI